MVWPSSGKLDGAFRYTLPIYCQRSENDHAAAPVRLSSVRNLCRFIVLGLGLSNSIFPLADCNSFGMYHTQTVGPQNDSDGGSGISMLVVARRDHESLELQEY